MNYCFLPSLSIVDFAGSDAAQVLNNLCTADIAKLALETGVETFVCDVRGKTIGHGCVYRHRNAFRFIGSPGQSQVLMDHADRYTIREDVQTKLMETVYQAVWGSGKGTDEVWPLPKVASPWLGIGPLGHDAQKIVYQVPWTGPDARLCLVVQEAKDPLLNELQQMGFAPIDLEAFHHQRIKERFPWYGIDLDASHLPQEADRDSQTISFTKGCYLGQETVARLDALGQVQKKLVRWSIRSNRIPEPGTELRSDARVVGTITSVAPGPDGTLDALGFARRSHFAKGSIADCNGAEATVVS